jgi:hypothetical protein
MWKIGSKELKLDYGKKAKWYYGSLLRNTKLIIYNFLEKYGEEIFIENISNPFCFDCFLYAIGFEEITSGTTTVFSSILKEIINYESGIFIAGGKSLSAFKVPEELNNLKEIFGFSEEKIEYLKYCSRMTAKVDNCAIQDGFRLYHHLMIISKNGTWAVIQQAMNPIIGTARRYHWYSRKMKNFVEEPHQGIISKQRVNEVLDMTSMKSSDSRKASLDILKEKTSKIKRITETNNQNQMKLTNWIFNEKEINFSPKRLPRIINWKLLNKLHENVPKTYEELLSIKGVGESIIRLLALSAEILYGIHPSYEDPAFLEEEFYNCNGNGGKNCKLLETINEVDYNFIKNGMLRRLERCNRACIPS